MLSQYGAALAMLSKAVELCPDDLWLASKYHNPFWHVAYHTVFYTHFYAQPSQAEAIMWPKHVQDSQYLRGHPSAPADPVADVPYGKADFQEFLEECRREVEKQIAAVGFEDPSGFSWLPFSKLELQLYNLRHLEHHVGQLTDRLRTEADIGLRWVRSSAS